MLQPNEQAGLLDLGLGVTNLVPRPTARADELTAAELRVGAQILRAKVAELEPRWLAVLGVTAYRVAFSRPQAVVGPQPESIGKSRLWVLPNPSGLNAHYQLPELVREFEALRRAVFS